MIRTIAAKEMLLAFRTIRFVVITLVCCLLIPISVAVLSSDYLAESEDYIERVKLEDRREVALDDEILVFRPVPELSALFRGVSTKSVNSIDLSDDIWNRPRATAIQSPIHSIFPTVDLTFVIGVVLSALAIMLSFDSIAGEKNDSTLRVIISNSFARNNLIIGKWMGLTVALLVPFLLGMVISILLYLTITGVNLSLANWSALSMALLFSCVYLSVFILIGIAISSFVKRSTVAIFAGLGVWGLFVILLPYIAVAIANVLEPTPVPQVVEKNIRNAFSKLQNDMRDKNMILAETARNNGWDRDRIDLERRNNEWPLESAHRRAILSMEMDYWNKIARQEDMGRRLSLLSPLGGLSDILVTLANTGPDAQYEFMVSAYRYGDRYFSQIYSDTNRFPSDEEIAALEKFKYRPVSLENRIGIILFPALSQIIFLAVFLTISIIGFNRYDVR